MKTMKTIVELPDMIRALLDLGFTQEQIAARCDCSQPVISRILNRTTINPTFSIGAAIVELYNSAK